MKTRLAAVFDGLDALPLESEDRALVMRIVLSGLERKGLVRKPDTFSLNKMARDVFRVSRERNEVLGTDCCPDPEWNMLLDLVVAETESRPVYISSLCIASGVPATTALRHVERMAETGLIRRKPCTTDRRRSWVELTPYALAATETLLHRVYEAGSG